jgi:hypothetical protein
MRSRDRLPLLVTLATVELAASLSCSAAEPVRGVADILGATHVAGTYHLSEKGYLEEGADQILSLGVRTIKAYLANPAKNYPFNAAWPKAESLVDLAESPAYRAFFTKPFTTYILTVYSLGRAEHYWRKGVTAEERADETRQLHALARHFLEAYRGTRKTFVLQHWEGDWAIRGSFERKAALDPVAVRGMIDWLDARQEGVDRARGELKDSDVRVLNAVEVNLVVQAMREGLPGVVDKVLPSTRVDLVSYSAWDAQQDPATLTAALDFIEGKLPSRPSEWAKDMERRVYIGEFGAPENDWGAERATKTVREVVETGLRWRCPWIVYWQVYCNEPRRRPVKANDDVRGFWLLRPDGTRAPAWDALASFLEKPRLDGRP